ncbi:MAG: hypothetical protein V4721_00525 [Bacteroidota bacterium]
MSFSFLLLNGGVIDLEELSHPAATFPDCPVDLLSTARLNLSSGFNIPLGLQLYLRVSTTSKPNGIPAGGVGFEPTRI